jgi:hypothetical protein
MVVGEEEDDQQIEQMAIESLMDLKRTTVMMRKKEKFEKTDEGSISVEPLKQVLRATLALLFEILFSEKERCFSAKYSSAVRELMEKAKDLELLCETMKLTCARLLQKDEETRAKLLELGKDFLRGTLHKRQKRCLEAKQLKGDMRLIERALTLIDHELVLADLPHRRDLM